MLTRRVPLRRVMPLRRGSPLKGRVPVRKERSRPRRGTYRSPEYLTGIRDVTEELGLPSHTTLSRPSPREPLLISLVGRTRIRAGTSTRSTRCRHGAQSTIALVVNRGTGTPNSGRALTTSVARDLFLEGPSTGPMQVRNGTRIFRFPDG
jgi:hypothetical protein